MEKYFEILSQCPLFQGVERHDLKMMIECLKGRIVKAPKGRPIFLEGDGTENSVPDKENPIYVQKDNERKADGLSFGSGKTTGK